LADKVKIKRDDEFIQLKRERDLIMKLVSEKEIIISIQKNHLKNDISKIDRMQVAQLYISSPLSLSEVLKVLGLSRSSFYFKPKTEPKNKAGKPGSTNTFFGK
jgi:predicted PilT family ATPase